MDQVEYDAEYEKARKELDDAAGQPITVKEEVAAVVEPEKVADTPAPEPEVKPEADPLEGIRHELEQTKKALKDTQSWGTRNAQELAQFKRESDDRKRQAERPSILDANPELEAAIKYVIPEVEKPQQELLNQHVSQRDQIIERAHPGIFGVDVDPELIKGIAARYDALGEEVLDPLACIREINAEKLAHGERVIGKRFAAENAKAAQKNAMTVPGTGGGAASKTATPNTDAEAVNRIANMSPAEFEKERRKVLGY